MAFHEKYQQQLDCLATKIKTMETKLALLETKSTPVQPKRSRPIDDIHKDDSTDVKQTDTKSNKQIKTNVKPNSEYAFCFNLPVKQQEPVPHMFHFGVPFFKTNEIKPTITSKPVSQFSFRT
jgi:hypothetical protein